MKKRLLTIDFWNTLYNSGNGRQRNAYRQLALVNLLDNHAGRIVMGDEIEGAISETWKYFEKVWKDEQRTIGSEESVEFLLKHLRLEHCIQHAAGLVEAFSDSVLKHPPYLMEGAKDVLEDISKEYDLALISDTGFSPGKILKQLMEEDGVDRYFSVFSFSDETGYSKPHPEAFKRAITPLGHDVSNSYHIGDIEHTDIKGAKEIGMKAIRFTGNLTDFATFRHSKETAADYEVEKWIELREILLA